MAQTTIKPIETVYRGCRFRSRLEARWAVFFDAMGIPWDYEPEGFELPDGTRYLPDFYLHVKRRPRIEEELDGEWANGCFAEVKGAMTDKDAHKIVMFSRFYPVIVLENIPDDHLAYYSACWKSSGDRVPCYSYCWIDGDNYPACFCKCKDGPWIIGPDHDGWDDGQSMDAALSAARQARFEYGETPHVDPVDTPKADFAEAKIPEHLAYDIQNLDDYIDRVGNIIADTGPWVRQKRIALHDALRDHRVDRVEDAVRSIGSAMRFIRDSINRSILSDSKGTNGLLSRDFVRWLNEGSTN